MSAPMDPATAEALAQINAKLDVLISQHGTVSGRVDDHETRIRDLESRSVRTDAKVDDLTERDADQEDRIRKADKWRYAMPVAGAGAAGAVLAGVGTLITALGG